MKRNREMSHLHKVAYLIGWTDVTHLVTPVYQCAYIS